MKDFLDLAALGPERTRELVARARQFEHTPHPDALAGKVVALLFMNPSLRTLASMQSGIARLGGSSFVITPGQGTWAFETRPGVVMDGDRAEHVREAIPVLARYADAVGIRAFADGVDLDADVAETTFRALTDPCPKPVINLESAMNHPCQALADFKTLDDLEVPADGRFVLTWAWHPRALPLAVPSATVQMAALRGMDVTVVRPDGFDLPDAVMARARSVAEQTGGRIDVTDDRRAALDGAHVVYAKSWGSTVRYGDTATDKQLRDTLRDWCVAESWFADTRDAHFMHCLPVRRNVVVADEVLDGPRSVVLRQAENRMWGQMAVLDRLLNEDETR